MSDFITVNGKLVPADSFDGPSGEEHTLAMRRFHRRQESSFYVQGTGVSQDAVRQPRNVQIGGAHYHGDAKKLRKHCRP